MKNLSQNQIAVMNIQYQHAPFALFLDDAVKNGVKNIELWGGTPHFYPDDMTYWEVMSVRHEIEKRNLRLICYTPEQCVYPVNLASPHKETRRRSIKFFEDSIRVAGELGTNKVLVTSGTGYFDDSDKEEAWKWSEENLYSLGGMAEHYGVTLALEVLRRDESNLVYNLQTLQKMLAELNHSAIGGMIDTIPMALAGEHPAQYLKVLGDRLVHVHFIDGAPRGHLAWGDGVLDMAAYLSEFDEYGYSGFLSLEITDGRYYMNPSASVEQSVKRLLKVI